MMGSLPYTVPTNRSRLLRAVMALICYAAYICKYIENNATLMPSHHAVRSRSIRYLYVDMYDYMFPLCHAKISMSYRCDYGIPWHQCNCNTLPMGMFYPNLYCMCIVVCHSELQQPRSRYSWESAPTWEVVAGTDLLRSDDASRLNNRVKRVPHLPASRNTTSQSCIYGQYSSTAYARAWLRSSQRHHVYMMEDCMTSMIVCPDMYSLALIFSFYALQWSLPVCTCERNVSSRNFRLETEVPHISFYYCFYDHVFTVGSPLLLCSKWYCKQKSDKPKYAFEIFENVNARTPEI